MFSDDLGLTEANQLAQISSNTGKLLHKNYSISSCNKLSKNILNFFLEELIPELSF